jgi:hypothetical protein
MIPTNPLARLAQSRKFWLAMLAAAQTVIFALWPGFPPDVWKALDALAVALIAAIACEDAAAKGADAVVRFAGALIRGGRSDDAPE